MRCLKCRQDGLAREAETCSHCGTYLPGLMQDFLPYGTLLDGGKYRLEDALGRGGFGITYQAFDLNLGRPVAIKEFYPQDYVQRNTTDGCLTVTQTDAVAYQRWLQRFEAEGQILAKLIHPGIVKAHALFKERGTAYLVMELLQGHTLADELNQQPDQGLAPARVVEVMTALVAALERVHQEGIYHLDLKPDNVMLTEDGRIVLIDFGSARQDLVDLPVKHHQSSRSKKNTAAFTMEYAPPELIGGQAVSACSDLFELGMMLHELLTGQRPESARQRLLKDTWVEQVFDQPWHRLIKDALRLQPQDRPQSVQEWWHTYFYPGHAWNFASAKPINRIVVNPSDQNSPKTQAELPKLAILNKTSFWRSWRLLLLGGLGASGLGGTWLGGSLGRPLLVAKPLITNPDFPRTQSTAITAAPAFALPALGAESTLGFTQRSFEVITVNEAGQVVDRAAKQAAYFVESLAQNISLEMLEIPAGEFWMGESDQSTHLVNVPAFFMGRFPITQAQWQAVMGNNPAICKGEILPVDSISWQAAQSFCQQLSLLTGRNYRLPSEAEWEYACRAGTETPFHCGATLTTELANYEGSYAYGAGPKGLYRGQVTPVGSFPPNGFGLQDMHGNVWEWCQDLWHKTYEGAPRDGSAWLEGGDANVRVMRGGNYRSQPSACQSGHRAKHQAKFGFVSNGLRVVLSEI